MAEFLAQRRLGGRALGAQQLGRARGGRLVVAAQERHQPAGDPGRAELDQALERDPAHAGIRVLEPIGQRAGDRVVALADRDQHGDGRGAQIRALVTAELDDRRAEVLAHHARR